MNLAFMFRQTFTDSKCTTTNVASVRSETRMNFQVICKGTGSGVGVVTYGTPVWSLASVDTHVCGEIPPLSKSTATCRTFVLFDSRVCPCMYFKRAFPSELPLTYVALIRLIPSVGPNVIGEPAHDAESCTTHMTNETFIATVSNSVTAETGKLSEGPVTYFTGIRSLLCVYAIVSDKVTQAPSPRITALVTLVFVNSAMTKLVSDKSVCVIINIITYVTFQTTLIRVDQFMSSEQAGRSKC